MKAVKYQKKSLIKLEDLLRRRKSTLKKFLSERGITSYQMLDETCSRMGVVTPSLTSFSVCVPTYVSDPTSGVVVVPPLDVIAESTGERQELNDTFSSISPAALYEDADNAENVDSSKPEIIQPLEMFDFQRSSKKKTKRVAGE